MGLLKAVRTIPDNPGGLGSEDKTASQCYRGRGENSVWYFSSNYDDGVPPALFLVDGSQGRPCDPKLIPTEKHPTSGGFIRTPLPESENPARLLGT